MGAFVAENVATTTRELTFALGRLIKRYRTANNISQAALGKEMGISGQRIKELESQNPDAIGNGGFQISTLVMFAAAQKKPSGAIWDQLIAEAGLTKYKSELLAAFETDLDASSRTYLQEALKVEDSDIGNIGIWALQMAAKLSRLSKKEMARHELAINEHFAGETSDKRLSRLFKITIS